ncbi:MAG: hypothetical protein BroJett003_09030 [Planctomycetota bacterium]|nr:MAG: hypothetical protein BroJett003_09030 [Planctomycetota bacterium]
MRRNDSDEGIFRSTDGPVEGDRSGSDDSRRIRSRCHFAESKPPTLETGFVGRSVAGASAGSTAGANAAASDGDGATTGLDTNGLRKRSSTINQMKWRVAGRQGSTRQKTAASAASGIALNAPVHIASAVDAAHAGMIYLR